MAQPQTTLIDRDMIERQVVLNRAQLQELDEQAEQIEAAREEAETQVIAAKAALEGWDLGYRYAKAEELQAEEQAEPPPATEDQARLLST
jgi:hypothetical protein